MEMEQAGATVRLHPFWLALQTRLASPAMLTVLGGGKVYRASDDYSAPEGPENKPWGRLVIVPADTLWPASELDSGYRGLNWLIRSEVNDFSGSGYEPAIPLEKSQQLAWELVQGWAPVLAGMLARLAIYRQRPPQPLPEYDTDRQLWWMSSEFRCEASRTG